MNTVRSVGRLGSHQLEHPEIDVVSRCSAAGLTIATAESLTAGLIAATVAGVPGASTVLRGGLVVYATDLKHSLAGVDPKLLDQRGPIDPDVARQLAQGAARRCGASLGIGVTGVAGPDPQDGHQVGEVWIGLWSHGKHAGLSEETHFDEVFELDQGWRSMISIDSTNSIDSTDRSAIRQAIRKYTVATALRAAVEAVEVLTDGG